MKSILYFILLILCMGCGQAEQSHKADDSQLSRAVAVRAHKVQRSTISNSSSCVGVIEAQEDVSLSFSVGGRVDNIRFEVGQRVKVGDVVATLDAGELRDMWRAAEAKLNQAKDAMSRLQKLHDSNTLAPIKFVEVQTALREAESLESVARKRMEDAQLKSTLAGVVAKRFVNKGENVAPHQAVVSVVSIDNGVSVKIAVGEDVISNIKVGQALDVEVDLLNGETLKGVVSERQVVANTLTYTYDVKVKISNPSSRLLPGMMARVEIPMQCAGEAIRVKPEAIFECDAQGRSYLWVVGADSKVSRRAVECGEIGGAGVEIISGLSDGEVVVEAGGSKLFDGAQVRVVNN